MAAGLIDASDTISLFRGRVPHDALARRGALVPEKGRTTRGGRRLTHMFAFTQDFPINRTIRRTARTGGAQPASL